MDGRISKDATDATLVAAALEGTLTDAQAEQLAALDPVLQKLAWLAAAQRIAEQDTRIAELLNGPRIDPATPSGQRAVYTKPAASNRKRPEFEPETYASRIGRIDRRLMALAGEAYTDAGRPDERVPHAETAWP